MSRIEIKIKDITPSFGIQYSIYICCQSKLLKTIFILKLFAFLVFLELLKLFYYLRSFKNKIIGKLCHDNKILGNWIAHNQSLNLNY